MGLQGMVAPAMVAVQVRVDQSVKLAALQRLFQQGQRLSLVRCVTAVHQGGAVCVAEQNVVGR